MSKNNFLGKALTLIGLSDAEASVLSHMLKKKNCTAEQLIKDTGLSRGTVYTALSHLLRDNYIAKSGTRPVRYSATSYSLKVVRDQLNTFYKSIMSEIEKKTVTEVRVVLQEICTTFEKNGYAIRDPPEIIPTRLMQRELISIIDKVAEGDYSIGIALLDKNKKLPKLTPEHFGYDFLYSRLMEMSRELNCLTTFVFVHQDLKDADEWYRSFMRRNKIRPLLFRQEYFGIPGEGLYVFKTSENLPEKIESAIAEIRQKRMAVQNMAVLLRQKMDQIQELILLSQGSIRSIDDIMTGKQFQFPKEVGNFLLEHFQKIAEPIQRIKNRESRNLAIFKRRFSEDEVRINNYLDAFERRIYLPKAEVLEKDIAEMEMLLSKFTPIEFELSDLSSNLFNYAINVIEAHPRKEVAINPFLFTEPYEPENFFVNEDSFVKAALELRKSIIEGLPSFFQLVTSEAGMGKTHALKYIYSPLMEKAGIKPIYIDCPLNYDLLAGIFHEITQESNFPETVKGTIRSLRRQAPSTPREFIKFIREIVDIWLSLGFRGVVIILDELENSLPYIYLEKAEDIKEYKDPLAFRQLRETLSSRPVDNLGFVLSCRDKIYPLLAASLKIENISKYTHTPETLSLEQVQELINHRYQMWSVKIGPEFTNEAIEEIMKAVNKNTRDIIKYCRELFKFAMRNRLKKVKRETVEKIGLIPLFRY
jgi:predicted transcriptional regulator